MVFGDSTKHTTVLVVPIEAMFAIQRSELFSRHEPEYCHHPLLAHNKTRFRNLVRFLGNNLGVAKSI